jgi:hypothetical protein
LNIGSNGKIMLGSCLKQNIDRMTGKAPKDAIAAAVTLTSPVTGATRTQAMTMPTGAKGDHPHTDRHADFIVWPAAEPMPALTD